MKLLLLCSFVGLSMASPLLGINFGGSASAGVNTISIEGLLSGLLNGAVSIAGDVFSQLKNKSQADLQALADGLSRDVKAKLALVDQAIKTGQDVPAQVSTELSNLLNNLTATLNASASSLKKLLANSSNVLERANLTQKIEDLRADLADKISSLNQTLSGLKANATAGVAKVLQNSVQDLQTIQSSLGNNVTVSIDVGAAGGTSGSNTASNGISGNAGGSASAGVNTNLIGGLLSGLVNGAVSIAGDVFSQIKNKSQADLQALADGLSRDVKAKLALIDQAIKTGQDVPAQVSTELSNLLNNLTATLNASASLLKKLLANSSNVLERANLTQKIEDLRADLADKIASLNQTLSGLKANATAGVAKVLQNSVQDLQTIQSSLGNNVTVSIDVGAAVGSSSSGGTGVNAGASARVSGSAAAGGRK